MSLELKDLTKSGLKQVGRTNLELCTTQVCRVHIQLSTQAVAFPVPLVPT